MVCAAVRHLQLQDTVVHVRPLPRVHLHRLSHLHLADVRWPDQTPYLLAESISLPRLTHLASCNTPSGLASSSDLFPHFGLLVFARQLEFVAFRSYQRTIVPAFQIIAPEMVSLKSLVILEPDEECVHGLGGLLDHLPASLAALELGAGPAAGACEARIARAFEQDQASVRDLQVLRLPCSASRGMHGGQTAARAEAGLRRAAELAEARGVQIEWARGAAEARAGCGL